LRFFVGAPRAFSFGLDARIERIERRLDLVAT
jgi:hypothetical protein